MLPHDRANSHSEKPKDNTVPARVMGARGIGDVGMRPCEHQCNSEASALSRKASPGV